VVVVVGAGVGALWALVVAMAVVFLALAPAMARNVEGGQMVVYGVVIVLSYVVDAFEPKLLSV
jgi:lipopolysaccharide export LptBFGC system permease protein LptF